MTTTVPSGTGIGSVQYYGTGTGTFSFTTVWIVDCGWVLEVEVNFNNEICNSGQKHDLVLLQLSAQIERNHIEILFYVPM
jgi:hypothetical protein